MSIVSSFSEIKDTTGWTSHLDDYLQVLDARLEWLTEMLLVYKSNNTSLLSRRGEPT